MKIYIFAVDSNKRTLDITFHELLINNHLKAQVKYVKKNSRMKNEMSRIKSNKLTKDISFRLAILFATKLDFEYKLLLSQKKKYF